MATPFDWLSAAEKCENQVADLESLTRRHRNRLLLLGGVALACGGLYVLPILRAQGRPETSSTRHAATTGPSWKRFGSGRLEPARRRTAPSSRPHDDSAGSPAPAGESLPPASPGPSSPVPASPAAPTAASPGCSGPQLHHSTRIADGTPSPLAAPDVPGSPPPPVPRPPRHIYVHVAGAVVRPGAVRVPVGARAFHAVAAAGGLLPRADLTRVNLARALQDEGMVVVPSVIPTVAPTDNTSPESEALPSPPQASPPARPQGAPSKKGAKTLPTEPVDLNTATQEQLETLPGVGSAMAQAIIEWRQRYGPYRQVRDLLHVPRIGRRLFARIEPHVRVASAGP